MPATSDGRRRVGVALPVHQCDGLHDKDEKLQISIGKDGSRCLLHCFAHGKHKDGTCNDKTITAALGLHDYHLYRPKHADRNGQTNGKPKPDRTHVYQNQHGDAVYKSVRRKATGPRIAMTSTRGRSSAAMGA